ncbi:uncharacterized protein LAESUDRAFT_721499 [Laetiporus sulphureus 93-53]|uniref:Caprin-1 dimerization domain-containing protein n=1 Tax=Laetiporus sulphureus 93-53 TaxID=1314785 RepID=A0A165H0F1_9APHY|nr:uncharacterized protein LAESUDRAFT_721499 [Laetiporus sulphureus 93-53]KZT11078.1 hypothetical protein LAESUDRAFT_721499 [Laetiporus sulphureus 93-53]
MSDAPAPTLRVVPGAPPVAQPSKSQKKKRKPTKSKSAETGGEVVIPDATSAALIEKAPSEADVKEGSVAPELVLQPEGTGTQTPLETLKQSPIVEMLNKRLRAIQKKRTRIGAYQEVTPENLNEDQKRLLSTLPSLEAVRKELEEVKKAIMVHEAEVAQEVLAKQAEVARIEREKTREAVAATETSHRRQTSDLLHFLRLRDMLSIGHPQIVALGLSEPEGLAIYGVTDALLNEESDNRASAIDGLISGAGEFNAVPYSRLAEITQLFLNPLQPEAFAEVLAEEAVEEPPETIEQVEASVAGIPAIIGGTGSFHFMQEDELENQAAEPIFEQAPWTEAAEAASEPQREQPAEIEITETVVEADIDGRTVVQDTVTVTTTTEVPEPSAGEGAINWADEEEGGLPSIGSLHAKFGTFGEASPAPKTPTSVPPTPAANGVNGHAPAADEEGFTPMRGRGRYMRGGFRGGERGGFRGGQRGGRGGERGGFRGGFRGGERGGAFRVAMPLGVSLKFL